jgi:DNA gyrase/topoisomerase IV subunit B
MKDNRKIVALSERDHILTRPNMYISSTSPSEKSEWILNDKGKIEKKNLIYSDGLYVIIKEILENALDEYIRTNGKYSDKITVDIKDDKIIIQDNGRGLPVEKGDDGEWMPITAFTKLRAGSNFSDDDRKTIGTNGYGSSATNVFSKIFEVTTCDGKKRFKLACKDNLSSTKYNVVDVNTGKTGTKVSFLPDYRRFGVECFPEELGVLLKTHLRMLSWFFPKCDFRFNGEKMSLKVKEISSMFPSPSVILSTDNIYILVYSTEEPEALTYVNGMRLRRGGNHVEYVLNFLTSDIKEKLSKKYKSIKPLDIKNRLGIVIFFKDFPNCQFDSQTKDALTNNEKDIKTYLEDIDLTTKLSNKILKEKAIIDNITELFQFKEDLKEKKELAKLNSKRRDIDSSKYVPCIGEKKYLCITEGQSAYGGIAPVLGRKGIAYYQIRGKILNVQDLSLKKAMENNEVADIISILGIDITSPDSDMKFDKVCVTTDQDLDGVHICSLLLSLFSKICPRMIKEGRICKINTPLLVGLKGRKVVDYYFTLPDQSKLDKRLTWIYQKGLGGWGGLNKDLLPQIIEKEGSFDNLLISLISCEDSNTSLERWMGDEVDYRKSRLRGKAFSIEGM